MTRTAIQRRQRTQGHKWSKWASFDTDDMLDVRNLQETQSLGLALRASAESVELPSGPESVELTYHYGSETDQYRVTRVHEQQQLDV